jgi:uncharacterized RDD family membrane protein YckC
MDLQRASGWKRIAAWVLDLMLLCVLAVGAAFGLSGVLDYDGYYQTVQTAYDRYAQQYGIDLDMNQADYDAMTAEEKADYDAATKAIDAALNADEEVTYAYNMVVNLSLVITTLGILLATLVLEFVVPLLLKNGQTIGKKCFSLGVVRVDGVKVTPVQLFTRTLLGKFAVETMIPVYVVLMFYWGVMGLGGTIALLILLIIQIVCIAVGQNRLAIHDRLAGTVVVDIASQKIFESTEDLIAYTKRIHAEQVKRQNS